MSDEPLSREALRAVVATKEQVPVDEVAVHETHISMVFVAGQQAVKFKKPVDLDFVDYRTRERRDEMCQREVALNRRLAPDIYRGLVSVVVESGGQLALRDGDGPGAMEHGVVMAAFDEDRTLEAQLTGARPSSQALRAVGERLAAFHDRARRVRPPASAEVVYRRRFDENLAELLDALDNSWDRAAARRVQAQHHRALDELAPEIERRSRSGVWRDGHGDLRAEHVVLGGEEIQVVDCVEFDDELRALDVADDLAFLVMDITRVGDHATARHLLDGYRAAGGDPGSWRLATLHGVYRAHLRAKVAAITGDTTGGQAAATARQTKHAYLAVADELAWRLTLPGATIICGPPASGKTTLAAALSARSNLEHVDSDQVRRAVLASREGAGVPGLHSPQADRLTYRALAAEALRQIDRDGGVIVEATFHHHDDRRLFLDELTAEHDRTRARFIECRVDRDVLLQRGRDRDLQADPSDADADVVTRQADDWEPLDEIAADEHLIVQANRPVERILEQLAAFPCSP